jgi:hypothetical protein
MKTIVWVSIAAVFLLFSCNKNQRKVNRIDGKWNVVSAQIEGFGQADPDVIYSFDYCKLRHDDFCDFSVHNFATNTLETGVYSIEDRGNTLTLTVSDGFGFAYREYRIVRLTPWRLVLESDNVPVGAFSRIELRKVK